MKNNETMKQVFYKLKEFTEIDYTSFQKGWECCLSELDRQKALQKATNTKRKAGKLIIEDFINDSKKIQSFLTGVYHNKGKQVCCDGFYLIVHNNANYDEKLEGKIISKDGFEIDGKYPNYEKVIPDYFHREKSKAFTLEDVQIISSSCKVKSKDKLRNIYAQISKDLKFSMLVLKMVEKFWSVYPEATLYCPKEGRFASGWVLEDVFKTKDLLVFMPSRCETDCDYIYDKESKLVVNK
jgi:hypothetical protein